MTACYGVQCVCNLQVSIIGHRRTRSTKDISTEFGVYTTFLSVHGPELDRTKRLTDGCFPKF